MSNRLKRLISVDWDAIAGVLAAVIALILHLLHVVQPGILLTIVLMILALLLIRDLRREHRESRLFEMAEESQRLLGGLQHVLQPPDVLLIGPAHLRSHSERFALDARGGMIYFNVCLSMFRPQVLFDTLLRPAIENPRVTTVQFVLDEGERAQWTQDVLPKVQRCPHASKVAEPYWSRPSPSFLLTTSQTANPRPC